VSVGVASDRGRSNDGLELCLDLSAMYKGIAFVNGECIGRYWLVQGTRPPVGFLFGSPVCQDSADSENGTRARPTQRFYRIPAHLYAQQLNVREESGSSCSVVLEIVLFDELGRREQGPNGSDVFPAVRLDQRQIQHS